MNVIGNGDISFINDYLMNKKAFFFLFLKFDYFILNILWGYHRGWPRLKTFVSSIWTWFVLSCIGAISLRFLNDCTYSFLVNVSA